QLAAAITGVVDLEARGPVAAREQPPACDAVEQVVGVAARDEHPCLDLAVGARAANREAMGDVLRCDAHVDRATRRADLLEPDQADARVRIAAVELELER